MNLRRIRLEYALYAAAFLLALAVRLVGLSNLPLSDSEARLALQSLGLAQGQSVLVDPHPAYLALTTVWMFLFKATNSAARFWPALAGSLLVLTPVLYRRWLGRFPALLLAFFLAFDPAFLVISRSADSRALAMFFVILALGLWFARRYALAGIAAGFAALSGPAVWPGLLALTLAVLIAGKGLQPKTAPVVSTPSGDGQQMADPRRLAWQRMLVFAFGTIFLAGTLFFSIPRGLSAMAGSIPAYLRGWAAPVETPVALLLLAVVMFEAFPLVFGLWGAVGTGLLRKNPVDRFLLAWFLVSTLLSLVYPGRQAVDLIWAVLPLWALAARQVVRLVHWLWQDRIPVMGQALLASVIIGFIVMLLLRNANNPGVVASLEYWPRLIGSIVLLISSTALIAWGWSRAVALRGLSWAAAFILFLFSLMAGWNAAGFSGLSSRAFWTGEPVITSSDLMTRTLSDFHQWSPLTAGGPELVVAGVNSSALRWALRDVASVSYISHLPVDAQPALVVTQDQSDLALAATYRGQGFTLTETAQWSQLHPADWLRWLVYRIYPNETLLRERVILWVRADLFPGGELTSEGIGVEQPAEQAPVP